MDDDRALSEEDVAPDDERESRIILATLSWIASESRVRDREAYVAATGRARDAEQRAA